MTTRRLCYRHHCEEIASLPDYDFYRANDWQVVPGSECELCAPTCSLCGAEMVDGLDGLVCSNCGLVEQ